MRLFREEIACSRHPRWDMREILLLVAAKGKQNEGIRDAGLRNRKFGCADERWDLVAAYCIAHGVDRNARECRRQWNNIFHGDYRRIRNWEKLMGVESFWTMSKEKRKEHQLPPTFFWEVFGQIETFLGRKPSFSPTSSPMLKQACATAPVAAINDKALFPKPEQEQPLGHMVENESSAPLSGLCGVDNLGNGSGPCSYQRHKRKVSLTSVADVENIHDQEHLATAIESSGKALQAVLADKIRLQIEAINHNSELDRSQRKEQGDRLISVLSQLANSLQTIAEKI